MTIPLADLSRCFQGIIPSVVVTSDRHGVPNVSFLSQVHLVDAEHVALSCQFFNKTRRNLEENPQAYVEIHDPLTFQAWRLALRFLRSEKSGPLFDVMALRIEAIASHTGMSGVFRLIAADIFHVERVEKVEGCLTEAVEDPSEPLSLEGGRNEIRGLQFISEQISRTDDLESVLEVVLKALEDYFGFAHTMILLTDEASGSLVTMASRGYGEAGIGAEVRPGGGLIGTVAAERRLVRISGLESALHYGRTVRREAGASGPEIPLPGLTDAQSAMAIPLIAGQRLIGVIAADDRDPLRFGDWHEAYLEVIANQIAIGIERMLDRASEDEAVVPAPVPLPGPPSSPTQRRTLTYYRNDDCVFVDGDYLIRNVPGRILWKLLREWQSEGRFEFSNRELRMDTGLGLPPGKDNLESRLILLRRRLDAKCPELKLVPTGRGRFALQVRGSIELIER